MDCALLKTKTYFPLLTFIITIAFSLSYQTNAWGQQSSAGPRVLDLRSIDPADVYYSDLQDLKETLEGVQLVLLGEQTHGEASTFLAKTRLIQFLHQEMDFEVLAFESGLYDCALIWENVKKGEQLSEEVVGSLFYMYATSRQMKPLFNYVQSQVYENKPLLLSGFESQHRGEKAKSSLFIDFEAFLKKQHPNLLDQQWQTFKQLSLATFDDRGFRPKESEKEDYFAKIAELKSTLKEDVASPESYMESPGFWLRITSSIESQAMRYWEMVSGNEVSVRDLQMAENLIWLSEKVYPDKKIIVWAHNAHIAKSMKKIEADGEANAFLSTFVPMGETIHQHFGNKAYAVGFSGAGGEFMNFVDDKIYSVSPASKESIEGQLANLDLKYAFYDFRQKKGLHNQKRIARMADFQEVNAFWPDTFDAMFFIKEVTPVDRP